MINIRKKAQILGIVGIFTLSVPQFSCSSVSKLRYETSQERRIEAIETDINKLTKELDNMKKAEEEAEKHYLLNMYMEQIINRYNAQLEEERIENERIRQEEEQRLAKENELVNRGINDFSYSKEVLCHVTYYTNINDNLQGGHKDKKGNHLTSHEEPVIALPSNIPYGSYIVFDEPVLGETIYKNVDTGGAIVWLNNCEMNVDIFVPNVSLEWIITNLHNKTVKATLYYK